MLDRTFICRLWIFAAVLLCAPAGLLADTVKLKSGEVLEGRILSETDTQIEMEVALYHGSIFSTRRVPKSDIESIVRETEAEKKEKAAYAALAKYTLNPNQELTTEQYAAGIAMFQDFLTKYPQSKWAGEVKQRLADWQGEASNVESGKVKFAGQWMTADQRKLLAERAARQAGAEAAQNALAAARKQLAELQAQREALTATTKLLQTKLAESQSKLAAIPESAPTSGGTRVGADRPGLAGQLTQRIVIPSQQEQESGQRPVPNPERTRLQSEIATYQQQINQGQTALGSIESKIQELQSQIPKLEQDARTASEGLAELSRPARTNVAPSAPATEQPKTSTSQPASQPELPWYKRLWKKFSG